MCMLFTLDVMLSITTHIPCECHLRVQNCVGSRINYVLQSARLRPILALSTYFAHRQWTFALARSVCYCGNHFMAATTTVW